MTSLPLIILGGSDRKPSKLPEDGKGLRPLSGYKAVDFRPASGRALVELVRENAQASGAFHPVFVAGPASIYSSIIEADCLIDTNGTFGQNIQTSLEAVLARHPDGPVGFLTCDVVADVDGLKDLMEQYWKSAPCDLWFPIVRVPPNSQQLGASEWKPRYRVLPQSGEDPVEVLPGHLLIFDPKAIRLALAYDLFQIAYQTRNRPINLRRNAILRKVTMKLFYHDFLHLISLRLPTLTLSILRALFSGSRELRSGTLPQERLEDLLRLVGAKYRHRKAYPDRRFILPIIEELSLALDIDTEEEARALAGRLGH